jgi:spore cortex biosynthesis protein YabQ
MILSISSQVYAFLLSVAGGMAIALAYDAFRILRRAVKTGSVATAIQDLLYWLMVAAIMFLTVFYSNDGELRAYLFFGVLLGLILYALLLSKIVMVSSLFVIKIITIVVKALVKFISYPIKFIIKHIGDIKRIGENLKKKKDMDDK